MRVVLVYKAQSEHARTAEMFLHDFTHQTGREVEVLDPDTKAGADFCQTYDIIEYPSMIALNDSGNLQNFWKGMPLPTISEVSYYV